MRTVRTIGMLLALSVILAHSVFPHHHHTIEPEEADHSMDKHHHHDESKGHHHDNENSDDHQHGLFTFGQIENTFLTGRQVSVPITVAPIIKVFEWSSIVYSIQEPDKFYHEDIQLPPLIECSEISFRGPPII